MSILERVGAWLDQKYANDRAIVKRMDSWIETEQLLKRLKKDLIVMVAFTAAAVVMFLLTAVDYGFEELAYFVLAGMLPCWFIAVNMLLKEDVYLFEGWRKGYIRIESRDVMWIGMGSDNEYPLRMRDMIGVKQSQRNGNYSIQGRYGTYDCRLLNMMRNSTVDSMLDRAARKHTNAVPTRWEKTDVITACLVVVCIVFTIQLVNQLPVGIWYRSYDRHGSSQLAVYETNQHTTTQHNWSTSYGWGDTGCSIY